MKKHSFKNRMENALSFLVLAVAMFAIYLFVRKNIKSHEFDDCLPDISGLEFINETQVHKGRNTMLECFATWCNPCKEEIPHLSAIALAGKVNVVSISSEDFSVLNRFYSENVEYMQNYSVARDTGIIERYMANMGVKGIPHCFLYDQRGSLIWHGHPAEVDAKL